MINKSNKFNKELSLFMVEIIVLQNAKFLGWNVVKISDNKYKLSKRISNVDDFNLKYFLDKITII